MGTRADFYIGTGATAEWLGSVAWDGYEWNKQHDCSVMQAKTADDFRAAVAGELAGREDATLPAQGWPWPWDDSHTTDFAYVLDGDRVRVYRFGRQQMPEGEASEDSGDDEGKSGDFPNMSAVKNVDFGARSGVMFFTAR